MSLPGGWLLPILWLACGVTIVVAAALAHRNRTAYRTGILATAFLWVNAGAAVNLAFLLTGSSYSGFADGSWSGFVTDTWESLVVPNEAFFIGLLVVGEATLGLMVLVEGRVREWALRALILFNVLLVSFGWGFLVWSVPLVVALSLLLRAGRRWAPVWGVAPARQVVASR
jgi:hypothetical protein